MADVVTCPDQTTLEQLLAGLVPDDFAGELEQHLLNCQICCQTVRGLLPAATRENVSAAACLAARLCDEPAVRDVASRVATLHLPDRSAPNTETIVAREGDTSETEDFGKLLDPPEARGEIGRFGGYRVLRLLGSGGMGLVWEAEDPQLRRHVAIKVMKPQYAKLAEHRERFLREARAAAAIDHSHIVTVYQVGEHRGVPFLAMQLLKGETLEDLLQRERRLSQAECLRIGRQMAEALAVAHRRGLIHRDVKPANTWLESDGGWVKLVDFGLAHAVEDDTHLTQTGMILGTPAFMSPEQARGEPVSPRSDLFSLGAVLYRMATGAGPFQGPTTLAVLTSLALYTPEAPRQLNPSVSPELSDLIMRLLAKDPAARPASADAVVAAIREIEGGSPMSRVQSPKSEVAGAEALRGKRGDGLRRRRWPWLVAAMGAAAMVLAGIVIIVRDKEGKILGEHAYPDADSAEVRHTEPAAESSAKKPILLAADEQEPPPLDEWLKGRSILTVSQDNRGDFKTIQAALDALQPGQAVEVLDRGPYRETLIGGAVADTGLVSRVGTIMEPGDKRRLHSEKDTRDFHYFGGSGSFRLSGFEFIADALAPLAPSNPWIHFEVQGNRVIENCRFAGGRASTQELLIYWYPSAMPGSSCHIRGCLFDTAMNVANSEGAARPVAVIEHNWFRSTPQLMSLQLYGQFERTVIRSNIFDGKQTDALRFSQAGETKRLEASNNTILPRIAAIDPLPSTGVILRNNLLRDGFVAEGNAGKTSWTTAAKEWQIANNQYVKKPSETNQLSSTSADFVGEPTYLSADPKQADYLRIASTSDEAHRGIGGDWPDYVGALPPGPAPKGGDWLTRWIKSTPTLRGGGALADGDRSPKTQDRLVAEWVHSQRGSVGGGTATASWVNVGPDDPLPDGDFSLGAVGLEGPIADADLVRLNGLRHLLVLGLSRTPIGDQGIANLGNLPELSCLYMGQTNVGDAGLRDLTRRFPEVRVLHAGETKITDAGVPALLAWKNLLELGLDNLAITDLSIATLAKLKYLRAAYLGRTSITKSGIDRLHAARPYCKIVSDFGTIDEPPIEGAASLRFNGINDYVDIPTLRYDARRPITIEASVRREPQPHQEVALVSNLMTPDGPPGAALGWHADSGWSFAVKAQEHRAATLAEPDPAPGQLAGVWDGRRLTLYFDGKQVASSDQTELAGDGTSSGHFVIGAARYLDGQQHYAPFMGIVDEVRISDVARYDGDYQPLSRLEADEHTLALYHFDEGEGQVLHDASGHGHDGKIVGGQWVKAQVATVKVAPTVDGKPIAPLSTLAVSEPPRLDDWLKGRKILTVSQDGKGGFKTIQAALDALRPGEVVEVLDRGPYRETLHLSDPQNAGLVSRVGTIVEFTGKREPTWDKDPADDHAFGVLRDFRLHGFSFMAGQLEDRPADRGWIVFAMSGDLVIENCRFADRRPNNGGLLIYWSATAKPGVVCHVRQCLLETSATINVTGDGKQHSTAVVERNWILSRSLTIHGSGKQAIVRHNVFDGGNLHGLGLLQTERIGRLDIYNNTFLSRMFAHDNLPATGVVLRNNLFQDVGLVVGADGLASLPAAVKGWQVGHNEYAQEPELAHEFPKADGDFVATPKFLSDDPGARDYLRIASDSDEAKRGAGGDLPGYLGALPPGPAPKEGDWLTRWIETK